MNENLTVDLGSFYKKTNEIAENLKAKKRLPRKLTPKVESVTGRNGEVIEFMRLFLSENDRMPKMSDLSLHFGWASDNSAQTHVDKLIRLNVLEKSGACSYRFFRSKP